VNLSWAGTFTLQSATNVTGPYVDVGPATNSYSASTSGLEKYFRLRN
jgi:hypothetical protein